MDTKEQIERNKIEIDKLNLKLADTKLTGRQKEYIVNMRTKLIDDNKFLNTQISNSKTKMTVQTKNSKPKHKKKKKSRV